MRSLGIDVAVHKGLDLVLMDESLALIERWRRVDVGHLGEVLDAVKPDIVAVDAPPRWALRRGGSRLTEREIRRFGIQVFGTPSEDRGDHPFYAWMRVGFRAFEAAEEHGFPLYGPPGSPAGTSIEVFPHATAVVLAGCLPPKGTSTGAGKREWRRRVLAAQGVRTDGLTSNDQVDAALAALTGIHALKGRAFAPGDPKEGVIVLPAHALPPPPYRRCATPPKEPEQPNLPGFAPCACGDPSCTSLTKGEFAPGHDAKRKSLLWKLSREGQEALDELRRRGWERPPEMR